MTNQDHHFAIKSRFGTDFAAFTDSEVKEVFTAQEQSALFSGEVIVKQNAQYVYLNKLASEALQRSVRV